MAAFQNFDPTFMLVPRSATSGATSPYEDPAILKKWERAIPRTDKNISSNNVVCEVHFSNEDILRFYEIKLPDGSVNRIKRGRRMLVEGAVPTIFHNLPSCLSNPKKRRNHPCERINVSNADRRHKGLDFSSGISDNGNTMEEKENIDQNIKSLATLTDTSDMNMRELYFAGRV